MDAATAKVEHRTTSVVLWSYIATRIVLLRMQEQLTRSSVERLNMVKIVLPEESGATTCPRFYAPDHLTGFLREAQFCMRAPRPLRLLVCHAQNLFVCHADRAERKARQNLCRAVVDQTTV